MANGSSPKVDISDPLGLKALKAVIDRINELADDAAAEKGSAPRHQPIQLGIGPVGRRGGLGHGTGTRAGGHPGAGWRCPHD